MKNKFVDLTYWQNLWAMDNPAFSFLVKTLKNSVKKMTEWFCMAKND